jgi:hypothetical protein
MSVIITAKVRGDTDKFRRALTERAAEFAQIAERARGGAGAIRHRRRLRADRGRVGIGRPVPAVLRRSLTAGVRSGHRGRHQHATRDNVCEAIESPDQF